MNSENKITTAFFKEFNDLTENNPNSLSALKTENKTAHVKYIFEIIKGTIQIDEIQEEIEYIIDKIGIAYTSLFCNIPTIEKLTIDVKLYLISWSTMNDLMSQLINTVFDLGISNIDVNLGLLLRNKKIQNSQIPQIFKKYNKLLNTHETNRARNNIIHRGKLTDEGIVKYTKKRNELRAKRFSFLVSEKISDETYKTQMQEIDKEFFGLVKEKKDQYNNHYKKTIALNSEIAIELAHIAQKRLTIC